MVRRENLDAVLAAHGGDGISGVDRPLEGVQRHDFRVTSLIWATSSRLPRARHVLAVGRGREDDGLGILAGHRHLARRYFRPGEPQAAAIGVQQRATPGMAAAAWSDLGLCPRHQRIHRLAAKAGGQ